MYIYLYYNIYINIYIGDQILPMLVQLATIESSQDTITSTTISIDKHHCCIALNAIRYSLAYPKCSLQTIDLIRTNMYLFLPLLQEPGIYLLYTYMYYLLYIIILYYYIS